LRHGRAGNSAACKMIASALLEMVVSILLAPVFLYFTANSFFSLLGKNVEWRPTPRRRRRPTGGSGQGFGLPRCSTRRWADLVADARLFLLAPPIVLGWLVAIPSPPASQNPRGGLQLQKVGLFLSRMKLLHKKSTRPPTCR
jgi:membrane glycosyltransferase